MNRLSILNKPHKLHKLNKLTLYAYAALLLSTTAMALPTSPIVTAADTIKSRFAPLANFPLETPAFVKYAAQANAVAKFTSDADLTAFIQRKIAPSPYVDWLRIGKTAGGHDLHLLVFTQDGRGDSLSVATNRKPTVWIIAQQHGNEPAGSEAALETMRRLVQTDLHYVLERINVVVMPRANPDGAANAQRETLSKGDMNRDHVFLGLLETQRLHAAIKLYPPNVVIDAHEFMASNALLDAYSLQEASDILVQSSNHADVAEPIQRLGREVFDPALNAAWQALGLSSFVYHTFSLDIANTLTQTSAMLVNTGNTAAGIARNAMGLNNAVSYLIETRGLGLGKANYPRRVASHVASMQTILRTSATHADSLRNAQREARKNTPLLTESRWAMPHNPAAPAPAALAIPMLSLATPSTLLRTMTVPIVDTAPMPVTLTSRPIPLAYAVPSAAVTPALLSKLRALGLVSKRSIYAQEFELESYTLTRVAPESREFDAPLDAERVFDLSSTTKRFKKTLDAGSLWIPMGYEQQANWRTAAAFFEPDATGSMASYTSSYAPKGVFYGPMPSTNTINPASIGNTANTASASNTAHTINTANTLLMPFVGQVLPVYRVMAGKLIAPQIVE
jgi:hypothetical protein